MSLKVGSLTHPNYPRVHPETPLTRARALMRDLSLRVVPVVREGGFLEGLLRREHVLGVASTKSDVLVSQVMENSPLVFKTDEDATKSFRAMIEFDEWYVPVVNESTGRYVGMLSLDSFLREVLSADVKTHEKRISEIMTTEVEYVSPEDFISRVWRKMLTLKYAGFPVVRGRDRVVVGIITQHDLLRKGYTRIELESESGPRVGPRVKEAMTSPAVTLKPYNKARDALLMMVKNDFGRVPIVNDIGVLVGIVDRSDLCNNYLGGL
ncbi:MAG: CBS domain-containing protein [Zestosphaera sp.]